MIYLIGGGMLKNPKPSQAKEVLHLVKKGFYHSAVSKERMKSNEKPMNEMLRPEQIRHWLLFFGIVLPKACRAGFAVIAAAAAVIYCDGAGNTPKEAVHNGSFLRRTGCHVLILGYYGWKGLPPTLSEIPVEYVEKAILWLKHRLNNESTLIGIAGMSAGGQYGENDRLSSGGNEIRPQGKENPRRPGKNCGPGPGR